MEHARSRHVFLVRAMIFFCGSFCFYQHIMIIRRNSCQSRIVGGVVFLMLIWRLLFPLYSDGSFSRFKLVLDEGASDDGDSEDVIRTKAFERGVLALPGTVFLPNGRKTAYVRASFSLTSEEDVELAAQRLREVVLDARANQKGA